jgi:hypothetical protein
VSPADGFAGGDFERAVELVGGGTGPEALAAQLGVDWDRLTWLALDAAATVLAESAEDRGEVVAYGGEAFTAGFLVGAHLAAPAEARSESPEARLEHALALVGERGRHAVIADHCDLESVARFETLYAGALVESMPLGEADRAALLAPMTRIFESGLAVGVELVSGRELEPAGPQQP